MSYDVMVTGIASEGLANALKNHLTTGNMPKEIIVRVRDHDDEWVKFENAAEHFLDPDAGAFGHEDRDNCREVIMQLVRDKGEHSK